MTTKDRVAAAWRHEETDIVPYRVPFDADAVDRLTHYYGDDRWGVRLVEHFRFPKPQFPPRTDNGTEYVDWYGTRWRRGTPDHVLEAALPQPSLADYHWPKVQSVDWNALAGQTDPSLFTMDGFSYGLFERAWIMRTFEAFMMDLVLHPGFVEELLDGILAIHLQLLDQICRYTPCDALFLTDDWGGQRGMLIAPDTWRRFFKPRVRQLIDRAHRHGKPLMLHCCGDITPIIPDLVELGLAGLESLQPEAMDVYRIKRDFGKDLVLMGGMGVQSTLPFGTPPDVRAETRRLIRDLGRGGGYILAPAKPIHAAVPPPNAAAFIEAAVQNGST